MTAGWRRRDEPLGVATARSEAIRLAKRIIVLDDELASNRYDITALVEAQALELLDLPGVGAITAAIVLTVWSHPGRIRSEAAFAQIAGTYPIPASSDNDVYRRRARRDASTLTRPRRPSLRANGARWVVEECFLDLVPGGT
ncbi:Transposase IS116/IS110/IS902 family protein [Prauserella aidingensis]|uniref:transposase n=1 Tax=Prauserella aidingensis TaxID=387890 RepID=UPI0020A241A2|nr:transposase [Prauserella aidingensis]MCP2256024.1 Transposase IS116/IS110/IS902 family protein [Prauserella aidingensis]